WQEIAAALVVHEVAGAEITVALLRRRAAGQDAERLRHALDRTCEVVDVALVEVAAAAAFDDHRRLAAPGEARVHRAAEPGVGRFPDMRRRRRAREPGGFLRCR